MELIDFFPKDKKVTLNHLVKSSRMKKKKAEKELKILIHKGLIKSEKIMDTTYYHLKEEKKKEVFNIVAKSFAGILIAYLLLKQIL